MPEENMIPLNEEDGDKIKGMVKTLARFRKREAANGRDTYRIGELITGLCEFHEMKGWGTIK